MNLTNIENVIFCSGLTCKLAEIILIPKSKKYYTKMEPTHQAANIMIWILLDKLFRGQPETNWMLQHQFVFVKGEI